MNARGHESVVASPVVKRGPPDANTNAMRAVVGFICGDGGRPRAGDTRLIRNVVYDTCIAVYMQRLAVMRTKLSVDAISPPS